jgi:DNA polymerase
MNIIRQCQTETDMTTTYETRKELISALRYQLDSGIDVSLVDTPEPHTPFMSADSLLRTPEISASIEAPRATPKRGTQAQQQPSATQVTAIHHTPSTVPSLSPQPLEQLPSGTPDLSSVSTLGQLKDVLSKFDGCALKKTASNLVFSDGNPDARIMLIGEAPGRDEDRMGLPFVGESGQLLDRMLGSVGFGRNDVYITNTLPWRPPGNRTPSSEEVQMLWPFLCRHIELKAPDIIVALGGSSAKLLLETKMGILKLRGSVTEKSFGGRAIPILATLHPAYLLRTPIQKRSSYSDLLQLRAMADNLNPAATI